jgi:hypothetical protein
MTFHLKTYSTCLYGGNPYHSFIKGAQAIVEAPEPILLSHWTLSQHHEFLQLRSLLEVK